MIGNHEDAQRALVGALDIPNFHSDGSTRYCYISSDGKVVYKVEQDGWELINQQEYQNAQRLSSIVEFPIRIPKTSLYRINGKDVIAMEYISGNALARCGCSMVGEPCDPGYCLPGDILDAVSPYICDTGGANVVQHGKEYYIIDMSN